MALAKSVECGNGLVVSASGHIITDRNLVSGCQVIVAAGVGNADQIAEDTDNGMALLRVYGARKLAPTPDPPRREDVTSVGIPDPKEQNDEKEAYRNQGTVIRRKRNRTTPARAKAGFSGAAAFDA